MIKIKATDTRPMAQIAKDWIRYIPTAIIPAIIGVLAAAVFTRIFPPHVYGVYSLILAISVPIINTVSQPISQPAGRFYYEYKSTNRLSTFNDAISSLLSLGVILLVILGAMTGLGLIIFARISMGLVIATTLYVVAQAVMGSLIPIMLADFQSRHYQIIMLGSALLSTAIPLILILLFGRHISFLILGNMVGIVLILPMLIKWSRIHFLFRLSHTIKPTIRRFLHYGVPFVPWFISAALLNIGDRFILDSFLGTSMVAIYSINYATAQQAMSLLGSPFVSASWPQIMKSWNNQERARTQELIGQLTTIYLLAAGGLVGILFSIGRPLMMILVGKKYVSGHFIIGYIALASAIWGVSTIGHKTMELSEKNSLMVWNIVAAALLNLGLNVWWIPRYGMMGAAIATIVGYGMYTSLIWYQSRTLLKWVISFKIVAYIIVVNSVSVMITKYIGALTPSPILSVFLRSAVYLVICTVLYSYIFRTNIRQFLNNFHPWRPL